MLPQAEERINELVPRGAAVLHLRAGGDHLPRADRVLDDVVRDPCAREPWPFADGRFAFAVCTRLAALRDPIGVCAELTRVARAGYVELPAVEAELAAASGEEARWLCDVRDGALEFVHRAPALAADLRLRVPARWQERLAPEDRVHGLFWEGSLPARERLVADGELRDELAERLRRRFEPNAAEVAVTEVRDRARLLGGLAARELGGVLRRR